MSIIYNFIIEFYLPTIHTFILARRNTIIFDSTKIIMKLARPKPEHSLLVFWLVLLYVSERGRTQSLILKEQYPVTAHAPNFDFWTGCREIKRCEESKRTLKNPFASRLTGFNTTLKLLRITDQ